MNNEYIVLRDFVLASTKMHIATIHAANVLKGKLDFLESRLEALETRPSDEVKKRMDETQPIVDEVLKTLEQRQEELLNALENFARG